MDAQIDVEDLLGLLTDYLRYQPARGG